MKKQLNNSTPTWSWKKWANGVIIIPEDTSEWVKYGTSFILAILAKYGYSELDPIYVLLIGTVIKAILDRLEFYLKNEQK